MKPLIGISCSYDQREGRYFLPEAYVEAVLAAGGIPVILPGSGSIKQAAPYIRAVNGLILAGGGDVDPAYFNEEPHPHLGEITPNRDRFEIMLIESALRKKMPILGICRGIQILNVACGGSVIQHIPAVVKKPLKHSQSAPRDHATHRVFIEKSSLLAQILQSDSMWVNSFHHQSAGTPAAGFNVSAISNDGVIEAIEHPKYRFVLGVQWHPECMLKKYKASRLLFKAFVTEAGKSFKRKVKIK
ncbi:MAG: gamma-glutamyl-gamma-aminobutyrate hydrolase family protein [Thermincola sp.]|jgi:putative glutamine amidotransferase|nr:gamma-glutamyl-gamma-aminobutyrate hydrolase family protein [Thermincola sp.]MDT3704558.1 gamma-glutamyl-gamma-aminobutyrate hydrolase family protein [Thermincola sp.]